MPAAPATDLTINLVDDEASLAHHTEIVAAAFGWETEQLAMVFRAAILKEPAWLGWVGYSAGAPVAASQLVTHNRTGGIYYVAVDGAHRRKGYGEAVTRAAIEAAYARGCDLVTLNASPDGYPIYRRMGFRDAGTHVAFTPPDEDE